MAKLLPKDGYRPSSFIYPSNQSFTRKPKFRLSVLSICVLNAALRAKVYS